MNYYVYAYLREDNSPYYIGKGTGNRINQKYYHRVSLPPKNRRIKLFENLTAEQAESKEIEIIRDFGRKCDGGILANITMGGSGFAGGKHTEETKRKWQGRDNGCSKAVEHIPTGNIYGSIKEAASEHGISTKTISNHCKGVTRKTSFRYNK